MVAKTRKSAKNASAVPAARAIPFIKLVDANSGKYEICDEAVQILEEHDTPIGVISIVGKYRTGKSLFLNKCFLQSRGFHVGNTVNACTKGLWIYEVPIQGSRDGKTMPVFLMDTEGLGALDADSTHDVRIFAMALLLSSYFIYNSLNAIDENAVQNLSLVANVCKQIRLSADREATPEELGREVFPPLLWIVRDFTLQLVGENGEQISAEDYLKMALQDTSSHHTNSITNADDKNSVRQTLRACFPDRTCATLIRPANDEQELQKLDRPNSTLKPLFAQQLMYIRQYILSRIKPKKAANIPMTGRALVAYARSIVDSINQGSAPVIRDSWTMIAEIQCRDAYEAATSAYHEALSPMKSLYDSESKPTEQTVMQIWKSAHAAALEIFRERAVSSEFREAHIEKLRNFMQNDKARLMDELRRLSESAITGKIAEIDSAFLLDSEKNSVIHADTLDRLEREMMEIVASIIGDSSSGGNMCCAAKMILDRYHRKSWCWMRRLAETAKRMETSLQKYTEERDSWMTKLEEDRQLQREQASQEREKYTEMQQRLSELNDALTQSLADHEAELENLREAHQSQGEEMATLKAKLDEAENLLEEQKYAHEESVDDEANQELLDRVNDLARERDLLREREVSAQEGFLEQIRDMRRECDESIETAKQSYTQNLEESQDQFRRDLDKVQSQLNSLRSTLAERETQLGLSRERARTLEEQNKNVVQMTQRMLETSKQQWEQDSVQRNQELSTLHETRLREQLEWSTKIRESEKRSAKAAAQIEDFKRKLSQCQSEHEPEMKRLRSENMRMKHENAKLTTDKSWSEKEIQSKSSILTQLQDKYEKLLGQFHELQRSKELDMLKVTMDYEKKLASSNFKK